MELTRKILIISGFVGLGFVALTLRTWVLGNQQNSYKKEIWSNFLFLLGFAVIAGFIIYLNN
jgi:hypothetical protein